MPSRPPPKVNLRTLILSFALLATFATLVNDLYVTYRLQRQALVHNALDANHAYAAKVALTIGQSLDADLGRLGFSAKVLGRDFGSAAVRNAEAQRLAEQDRSFNTTVIADAAGRIVAAHPAELSLNGQFLRSKAPLQRKQAMISPAFSSVAGNLIVFVSQPIWSEKGEYLGLVGGTIYLRKDNALNQIVSEHFQQDTSYVYLVDGNRRLLFHPNPERIGETVGGNLAIDAVLGGQSGAMQVTNVEGEAMLAGYAPVSSSGWGVVSQQPLSVTQAALRTLMIELISGIVPMGVFGFALLWWAASRISQPLSRLADYAERMENAQGIRRVRAWYYEAWRVRRAMIIAARLTQERIGKLNRQALSDPLTGLANRRVLDDTLRDWAAIGQRFAVISMDIDHFKRVNDAFGHDAGDKVLQAFAALLKRNSREGDIPCRVGGEEFILLLPSTDPAAATEVAQRIRRAMATTVFPHAGSVTLSLGVAWSQGGQQDIARTLKEADELLYLAKQTGRNKVMSRSAEQSVVAN